AFIANKLISTAGTYMCCDKTKCCTTLFLATTFNINIVLIIFHFQACLILSIPQILTEQYPKGLGPTVPELGAEGLKSHTKTSFSMLTESVESSLKSPGDPQQVILCGIEAQACIACTTYDLLERGMEVHIVADAIVFLLRLKQSGAFLTTTERVLLQLVQDAKHPNFKEIQKLLAHPSPDTGLLAFFSSL
uniref:Isochorismatase domain containing 2 n=1 Tax=Sinocyclocheilus grahami TaxID=75366 RepID=A0A672LQA9_SINGR